MVPVAIVRHGQRDPLVLLPALLPAAEPDAAAPADPLAPELLEPAPVSVDTEPEIDPEAVVVGETAGEVVSLVVDETVGVVVSLVVDGVVGEAAVVVVVAPGLALAPELLYEVLAPLLQPGRAPAATARTAKYGIRRFMSAPFRSALTCVRQHAQCGIRAQPA